MATRLLLGLAAATLAAARDDAYDSKVKLDLTEARRSRSTFGAAEPEGPAPAPYGGGPLDRAAASKAFLPEADLAKKHRKFYGDAIKNGRSSTLVVLLAPHTGMAALATVLTLEGCKDDFELVIASNHDDLKETAPGFGGGGIVGRRLGDNETEPAAVLEEEAEAHRRLKKDAPPPVDPLPPGVEQLTLGGHPTILESFFGYGAPDRHDGGLSAALNYFHDRKKHGSDFTALVIISQDVLISDGVITALASHVSGPDPVVDAIAPLTTPESAKHKRQSLSAHYDMSPDDARWASHPLSYKRVHGALQDAAQAGFSKTAIVPTDCVGGHVIGLSREAALHLAKRAADKEAEGSGLCDMLSQQKLKVGLHREAFVFARARDNKPPKLAEVVPAPKPGPQRHSVLLVMTAAGVREKTIEALLTLEGTTDSFDLLLAVTPIGADDEHPTSEFAAAAGIAVLKQPKAVGLTDLWNRAVHYAFVEHDYDSIIISNNDVLVPDGTVSHLSASLRDPKWEVIAITSNARGGMPIRKYWDGLTDQQIEYLEHPLSFNRMQMAVSEVAPQRAEPASAVGFFVAFFWGLTRSKAKQLEGPDGFIFNSTANMNFGQEKYLMGKTHNGAKVVNTNAYAYHYRGQTLGMCHNGQADCAFWQEGHHQDEGKNHAPTVIDEKRVEQELARKRDEVWWRFESGVAD